MPDNSRRKRLPVETGDVLIVDDEMLIAAYLEDTLETLGFRCCGIAGSAEEAVALAQEHRPAIALVDIGLRGTTDGIELGRHLSEALGVAVVFLSGAADTRTRHRAEAVAHHGFLAKPCSEDEIAAVLTRFAGSPRTATDRHDDTGF
ncbi:response regulator [Thalassobaculum sp.]|uniref:response regulator n=1 Tax=Thalassobaculum sp. TaxID=2022740 RepID=UPI0032EAA86D